MLPAVLVGAAVGVVGGCGDDGGGAAWSPPPPPEVTVAEAAGRVVREWDEYTGRLQAADTVEIRARVSGYLESVHFVDGELVEAGDLLFVVDPRPYQAVLDAAGAEEKRAGAALELAQNDLERAERLLADRAISAEDYDTRSKEVQQAQAVLEAARALVASAALDLEFTRVLAPISGRVSRRYVDEGNLISGGSEGSTLLTRVVSLDPIHCYFTASEQDYLRYARLAREGDRPSSREVANPVEVALADEAGFPHRGRMDFVDNQLDASTGTIRGRAVLPNPDGLLTPGLFVKIRLLGSGEYDAVLVPDQAIGTDQSRRFVYVIQEDGTAAYRNVTLGPIIDGLRVIRSGLAAGEVIVIEGLQRVRAGEQATPDRVALDEWLRRGEAPPAGGDAASPSEAGE